MRLINLERELQITLNERQYRQLQQKASLSAQKPADLAAKLLQEQLKKVGR